MELLPRGPSTFDSLSHPERRRIRARDPAEQIHLTEKNKCQQETREKFS